jgi:hypothetical protein
VPVANSLTPLDEDGFHRIAMKEELIKLFPFAQGTQCL